MTDNDEVLIRLWQAEQSFVYTVRRGGEGVELGVVPLAGPLSAAAAVSRVEDAETVVDSAYYGGSAAMD